MKVTNRIETGIITAAVMLLKPYVHDLDEVSLIRAIEAYNVSVNMSPATIEKPVPFDEAMKLLGITKPTLYKYIRTKGLKSLKIGKRTFITAESLQKLLTGIGE